MSLNKNSDFDSQTPSPFHQRCRSEETRNRTCFEDIGGSAYQGTGTMCSGAKAADVSFDSTEYQSSAPRFNNGLVSAQMLSSGFDTSGRIRSFGKRVDSKVVADTGHQTDADDKSQGVACHGSIYVPDSFNQTKGADRSQKALKRLAQNREAARKSRMRKKVYVQQLESSCMRLEELEQELKTARPQSFMLSRNVDNSVTGNGGCAVFDLSYATWSDEHSRLIGNLRRALKSQSTESQLRLALECVMSHYDELFHLKSIGAKYDVFHMLSGMWKTPAERCFMWLGGFRCSEILKIIGKEIEPLTEQQLVGMCDLQQSSHQAEDALSQGMEALQQSIMETLSSTLDSHSGLSTSGSVVSYMEQMATAMSKLAILESFLHQADLLRQQTLHRLQRILTTHQAARALVAISDYRSRLLASSFLWLRRSDLWDRQP